MGKGSTPRPFSVSNEEYANRWDAIFQRDLPTTTVEVPIKPSNETEAWMFQGGPAKPLPASLIEGIMSVDTCGHPFCDCKDVCKEAK